METVIIVAGGSGSRMQTELPKQFIEIDGKAVLIHTIEAFLAYNSSINIIIVLPKGFEELWGMKIKKSFPQQEIMVCVGGATRTESVKNGLSLCSNKGIVAIHDAARPFASAKLIGECFTIAQQKGSCIPCISCNDSARVITNTIEKQSTINVDLESSFFDRSKLLMVQTPQCFDAMKLKELYANSNKNFSDDAALWESAGEKIFVCEGETKNFKITTPIDLLVAKAILTS